MREIAESVRDMLSEESLRGDVSSKGSRRGEGWIKQGEANGQRGGERRERRRRQAGKAVDLIDRLSTSSIFSCREEERSSTSFEHFLRKGV